MIRRPDGEGLKSLAREWGIDLSVSEVSEYLDLADYMLAIVDGLEPDLVWSEHVSSRDPGGPLSADDDPLNAIVRRFSVKADNPSGSLLAGKRIAVKDNISVAGVPLTAGTKMLDDYIPSLDSTVVARILDQGGEIVASTNMDFLSCSAGGESSSYGPIRNPIDPTKAAGGSSSGSAASLHYPWIDISLGCDQGGSIRLPSSWCGVIGLKPTHGLVPYTGIVGLDHSLDFCGPMGRNISDVAALLQTIAGLDGNDPRQGKVAPSDYVGAVRDAPRDFTGVRVGLIKEALSADVGTTPGMIEATNRFVAKLRDLGALVTEISVPEHLLGGAIAFDIYAESLDQLLRSGGTTYESDERSDPQLNLALGRGLKARANDLSPQVKILLMVGRYLNTEYHGAFYAAGQGRRQQLREAYDLMLAKHDILLLPTAPWTAHDIANDATISEHVKRGWDNLSNTSIFDLTGHPALSIPAEEDAGLPAGMQIVGKHGSEAQLLSFAATVEAQLGWFPRV